MRLSIFNSLDAGATVEHEMNLVVTGDWLAFVQFMQSQHNGRYASRIFNDGLAPIMETLDKVNKDISFVSVINNSCAIGFNGGLTVKFVINYNRDSIAVEYNLPTYC